MLWGVGSIRVVLDIWTSPDGRIDGTISSDGTAAHPFEGLLALMAALEDLLAPTERTRSSD